MDNFDLLSTAPSDIHTRHLMEMRNLIINGNINGVRNLIYIFKNTSTHMFIKKNYVYSLKNNFIKICMTCCSIAVKGNAPYYKMMSLSDRFVSQFEQLTNTDEIIKLTFTVVETYTRAVATYSNKMYSKPVKDVLNYIQNNYSSKITLDKLSEAAELSTFYISRLIKKETRLSLSDNINKIRIEESKFLLQNTNQSVMSISQAVGFNYQNHFATIFKKFAGVSPNEFRNNIQKL